MWGSLFDSRDQKVQRFVTLPATSGGRVPLGRRGGVGRRNLLDGLSQLLVVASALACAFSVLALGFSVWAAFASRPVKLQNEADRMRALADDVRDRMDRLTSDWAAEVDRLDLSADALERKRKQESQAASRAKRERESLEAMRADGQELGQEPGDGAVANIDDWTRLARQRGLM